jgi:hypothetical protein
MATDYKCPFCRTVVSFRQTIPYGVIQVCPAPQGVGTCGAPITSKNRYYDPNPHGRVSFASPRTKKVRLTPTAGGRSASAPPLAILAATPAHTTRVANLASATWTNTTTTKIRLAYDDLDPGTPGMQGLVIVRPELAHYVATHGAGKLKRHFEAVADLMEANVTRTDATEGTGEAAAALGVVVNKNHTYKMLWGMNVHRGAGIDQIWGLPDPANAGQYTDYLIVEAKGPNQTLTVDPHRPGGIGTQMSHDWIIDNLARMEVAGHAVATRVLTAVGLATHVPPLWRNYGGATKSYYGVSAHNPPALAATLHAMVITAAWTGAGALTYNVSGQVQHY